MSERLLGHQKHPLILVDWSPINGAEIFQVLRASIPMDGRALTIYEKAYCTGQVQQDTFFREFSNSIGDRSWFAECSLSRL